MAKLSDFRCLKENKLWFLQSFMIVDWIFMDNGLLVKTKQTFLKLLGFWEMETNIFHCHFIAWTTKWSIREEIYISISVMKISGKPFFWYVSQIWGTLVATVTLYSQHPQFECSWEPLLHVTAHLSPPLFPACLYCLHSSIGIKWPKNIWKQANQKGRVTYIIILKAHFCGKSILTAQNLMVQHLKYLK